jgi:hypothetical protein
MSTWHAKFAQKKQDQIDDERKKKVEVNDISFPSLGNTSTAWGDTTTDTLEKPKLASLVAEWEAKAKDDEMIKKYRESKEAENKNDRPSFFNSRYRNFGNTHSRDEDTYYEDEYEDKDLPPVPNADTSSDWRTIERPIRKPKKTAMEKMLDTVSEVTPVEETSVWRNDEESVWGDRY